MQIKTFRAKTMREALHLVRHELGAEASVLHTRELNNTLVGRILGRKQIEIAAGVRPLPVVPAIHAEREESQPSELTTASLADAFLAQQVTAPSDSAGQGGTPTIDTFALDEVGGDSTFANRLEPDLNAASDFGIDLTRLSDSKAKTSKLDSAPEESFTPAVGFSDRHFEAFTQLLDADIDEATSLALLNELRGEAETEQGSVALTEQLTSLIAKQLPASGAIQIAPSHHQGKAHVVALVGPTGVGKTTTLAKLAANFHLRDKVRVGLLTVDTYRVAAVEQLKTYAEIIGLPMEVVSTPREMRDAMARLQHLDLVLLDTAGRSPRDAIKINELKAVLREAHPDEVHLVLSATSSGNNLLATAEQFDSVGIASLLVTKLDEATSLGRLVTLTRQSRLPLSYLTHGQNVPDDISVADSQALAKRVLEASR